jgi:hypothetical protein
LKLVIFLNITLFFLISFFIKRKQLHPFENIFLLLILEFIFTGYIGVIHINLKVWEISEREDLYILFRINEVILTPLLYLWCLNIIGSKRKILEKVKVSLVYISLIYSLEFLLVKWKVIIYKEWSIWQSLLVISTLMLVSYILLVFFRKLLRKESLRI